MAIVEQRLRMFEEVRGWLETLVESDDLLRLGKIPYPILQVGMCLELEYRDVYEIDHNYRLDMSYDCTLRLNRASAFLRVYHSMSIGIEPCFYDYLFDM